MPTKLVGVLDSVISSVYTELEEMTITLDPDPLIYGPKRLNAKIATSRNFLDRCGTILIHMTEDMQRYVREHRRYKLDYEMQVQDLLANDPEVRSGRSVRDREALANTKLRDEREYMSMLESSISELEMVLSILKVKREDLKDVQGRIRDQIKLCQEDLGMGAKWGTRHVSEPVLVNAKAIVPTPGMLLPDSDLDSLDSYVRKETGMNGHSVDAFLESDTEIELDLGLSFSDSE